MMSNLFSIFDTNTNTFFESNWISSLLNMLYLPQSFWLNQSKMFSLFNKFSHVLHTELSSILNNKFNYLNQIFFTSLFYFILFNNILGLFPYIFTSSSHMVFSVSVSLPMWISLMLFSSIKNTNLMFSHMIPQGTPNSLMPFMVLIETISNIIRPMTLSIRLTANMIAGHLLLTLLSQSASSPSFTVSISIVTIQVILLILEFSVSIIQSYVFMILVTLYSKETN